MDWEACKRKVLAKEIRPDRPFVNSLLASSAKKLRAQALLNLTDDTATSRISLAYEALRELLEALAISKGYKIYNHECFTAFLKEVLGEAALADAFDKFRALRNSINYYGKDVSAKEAVPILTELTELIQKIKARFFK